jgi:hypothetical protein
MTTDRGLLTTDHGLPTTDHGPSSIVGEPRAEKERRLGPDREAERGHGAPGAKGARRQLGNWSTGRLGEQEIETRAGSRETSPAGKGRQASRHLTSGYPHCLVNRVIGDAAILVTLQRHEAGPRRAAKGASSTEYRERSAAGRVAGLIRMWNADCGMNAQSREPRAGGEEPTGIGTGTGGMTAESREPRSSTERLPPSGENGEPRVVSRVGSENRGNGDTEKGRGGEPGASKVPRPKGLRVCCPKRPDWGLGHVLSEDGAAKVTVFFVEFGGHHT